MKTAVLLVMAFLVMVSLAFGQSPTGLEPVRNDAPTDDTYLYPSGRLHEYTIYRGTPVVDGDLSDWLDIPFTEMDLWQVWDGNEPRESEISDDPEYSAEYDAGVTFPCWHGVEDCAARFKMLWDDNSVYFVTVQDDDDYKAGPTAVAEPWKIWEGDNVQIGIDVRDPSTGGSLRADSPETNTEGGWAVVDYVDESFYGHWNALWVDPDGGEWSGGSGWPLELSPGTCTSPSPQATGKAIHGNYDFESNRITFELALDHWLDIVAGAKQMMAIITNDGDPAGVSGDRDGRQGAMQWGRGIINPKDTRKYGSILFSDQTPPETAVETSTWGKIKSTY
jgi:hypothetical protein